MSKEEIIAEIDSLTKLNSECRKKINETLNYVRGYIAKNNDEAYNQGLNDSWELASKVFSEEYVKIWGKSHRSSVFKYLTPQEALTKLEVYEKEQDQICVGDVVESTVNHKKYVIIKELKDDEWDFFVFDIETFDSTKIDTTSCKSNGERYFKKTGKRIDIQQILKQMGE